MIGVLVAVSCERNRSMTRTQQDSMICCPSAAWRRCVDGWIRQTDPRTVRRRSESLRRKYHFAMETISARKPLQRRRSMNCRKKTTFGAAGYSALDRPRISTSTTRGRSTTSIIASARPASRRSNAKPAGPHLLQPSTPTIQRRLDISMSLPRYVNRQ